jgi:F420-0:gamma-glutamyl ligase-like protein
MINITKIKCILWNKVLWNMKVHNLVGMKTDAAGTHKML